MKTIGKLAALIGSLAIIVSATITVEGRYTKDVEFHRFIDNTFIQYAGSIRKWQIDQEIDTTQERIWRSEDRIRKHPTDETERRRLRELMYHKQNLERQRGEIKNYDPRTDGMGR